MHTHILRIAIIIGITLLATGVSWAGSIDPTGGAVDGSGDPQSTTQIPPAWSQVLPCDTPTTCVRFEVVMGGAAVLDKETGLTWEQSPDTTNGHNWEPARVHCNNRTVGGRFGWRLPSMHELASLLDPNNPTGNPDLPPSHPFSSSLPSTVYWTATEVVDSTTTPTEAWNVDFKNSDVGTRPKDNAFIVWCVRGGGPLSEY